MADAPQFAKFVRSVPGFAVQRSGTREYIGATRRVLTKDQRDAGESSFEWSESIVPLTIDFCRKYARDLREHVRLGELVEVKREDWEDQQKASASAAEVKEKKSA